MKGTPRMWNDMNCRKGSGSTFKLRPEKMCRGRKNVINVDAIERTVGQQREWWLAAEDCERKSTEDEPKSIISLSAGIQTFAKERQLINEMQSRKWQSLLLNNRFGLSPLSNPSPKCRNSPRSPHFVIDSITVNEEQLKHQSFPSVAISPHRVSLPWWMFSWIGFHQTLRRQWHPTARRNIFDQEFAQFEAGDETVGSQISQS